MKTRLYILPLLLVGLMLLDCSLAWAQERTRGFHMRGSATELVDSLVRLGGDSLERDTAGNSTPVKERFVRRKVDLDHVVNFQAKDSIVMYGKNRATIFGSGQIGYGDITLTAEQIAMDMDSSQVHAIGQPDSVGELQGKPVFKERV